MNDKKIQQAFVAYLMQISGAKTQQELEDFIQSLGKEGIQKAYKDFTQKLQQQQVQSAKRGAKIQYLKSLKGDDSKNTNGAIGFRPIQKQKEGSTIENFKKEFGSKKAKAKKGCLVPKNKKFCSGKKIK